MNKLKMLLRANWYWLVFIFLSINAASLLYIRYTKNIYESSSELKLEVKDEASDLGIRTMMSEENVSPLSGEIEIIQSRLFLSRVLDSARLDVSYYSIGRFLNDELFRNGPFSLTYRVIKNGIFNTPIFFEEEDEQVFTLRVDNRKETITGRYNEPLMVEGMELLVRRNADFKKGDEVGYFFIINTREFLLDYLLRNLTAEPLNYNANTFRISFKDHNPHKAQTILNKIDSLYLHYSNEQKNLANKQKIGWLSNELAQIERKMEGYENYFENFTLQNKTSDLDLDLTRTIAQINRLDSQRYHVTQRLTQLESLTEALKRQDYILSFTQRQALPETLNKNLDELQTRLLAQEKLKMSYSEKTFAFRERQKEIEALQQKTLAQVNEIKTQWIDQLEDLNQRKRRLEEEFATLPDKSTEFSKNLRFYKLNEQFYLTLMQSKSEFEIAQAGSIPNFKILSPASFPAAPIAPKKSMIAGAGFVVSLMLIVLFVGVSYIAHNKITGLPELERMTDIPVLGVVPASRPSKNSLYVIDHPKSIVSESIRTLRTNLDFFNIQSPKRVIAISSTVSGEGKSFIAMNLGSIMALSQKKVILLDLDMRKPKTDLPFTSDKAKGISTILIKKNHWKECVIKSQLDTFDYIPSGPHPPNPSELLLTREFEELLEELKKTYDYIVLDTPPVGLVTDGIMAMKRSDISIYVFRANYSKKDFLFNLQRIVNINKFSNITMVLNALPPNGQRNYGYGYYEEAGNTSRWKKFFSA